MKNIIIILAILTVSVLKSFAGNYETAMGENIQKLSKTQNVDELTALSNTFDRIGEKESDKWLPYYYSSYATVSILFFSPNLSADEKKHQLDKAQEELDKAIKLKDNESENYALQALIYQMCITDPSLGQKYSMLANEAIAKAEVLNPENPRVYYLKATTLFYTPTQYGGGKDKAKPLFEKAAKLFANRPNNKLMPNWGSYHNNMMLEQYKK